MKNMMLLKNNNKMTQDRKTIAISEIVKIIEKCRYDDELSERYKKKARKRKDGRRLLNLTLIFNN